MNSRNIPFVGLHAHSVAGSVFDAIGYPSEHMDFAYENGSPALALTDHGNMNGLAHQVLHAKKMQSEGKDFKPIFGCEAYFIPSVQDWKEEYEKAKAEKKLKKKSTSGVSVEDEEASKKEVKNILNRRRHLILLAQNQTGLNNLFKLVSESYKDENFYRYPRVDYNMLKENSEGIIAASACLGGVYAGCFWENREEGDEAVLAAMREVTERMIDIFGDRWYGELQWNNIPEQHKLNKFIIQMHKEYGIRLISTADSHYPGREAWKDRELYKRLGWLGKKPEYLTDDLPSEEELKCELYPKNGQQMWESYRRYSQECDTEYDDDLVMESFAETHRIAFERIEDFMPDTTVRLPDFVVPEGATATQALARITIDALRSMGLHDNDEYVNRLKHELYVIDDRGFSKYFLTMKAIVDRANRLMLTGPGRGSAAGSLVAYILGITQIDPLKYDLQFARFLRSDATDYPDIDYDVAEPMSLKEALIEEWGDNTVVPISNWNTLQLRSLVKDISKFYNIPFTEVNKVTGAMIKEATGPAKKAKGMKAGMYTPNFEEVMKYSPSLQDFLEKYPHVKTHIEALHGQVRSCSRHAGGVVIAENLNEYMPLINSGGVRQTPWSEGQNVRHLEPMGFIKFDLLGLSTLRMIEGAIVHVLRRYHNIEEPSFEQVKKFYDEHLHPDKIDLQDKQVYENIFHKGDWAGVFQFTEEGAQNFCVQAKPTSIIDIAAVTSIFRPGPLSAKVDKDYIEAKESPQYIQYPNDEYRKVTEETYGFLIFQEQISSLAHRLGKDLSLDEGNMLRKVLTKKGTGKAAKVKEKLYKKFVDGCVEKGMARKLANSLWEKFEYFSGYGFNKSHAISYSMISFQCAWLLNYYPECWMAAFLDKEPETRKAKAISIAKKHGFKIAKLNINTSGRVWDVSEDGKTLIQPLTSIKGLGESAMKQVLDNRPFDTIETFLFNENVVYSKLNKKAIDVLVRSGAMEPLIDERFTGSKHFWSAVAVDRPRKLKNLEENISLYAPEGDFNEEEKIQFTINLTGEFPMEMVMSDEIRNKLDKMCVPPISQFDPDLMVTWFIPRNIIEKKTKNGKLYWILEVIDENNEMTNIKCWGVDPSKDHVALNRPYMARLDYNDKWGFSTRSIRSTFRVLG